jgi:undecaprenyl-diphosphatase
MSEDSIINNSIVRFLNTDGIFILILFAIFYLWLHPKHSFGKTIFIVLVTAVFSILLKELFGLPRPFDLGEKRALAGLNFASSFPSLHTSLAFALAANMTYREKRVGIIFIILAILVSLGRIAANVHYPIDIIFGIIIGIIIAVFVETTYPLVSPMKFKKRVKK